MDPPTTPPSQENSDAWRDYALSYLRREFGDKAPSALGPPTIFRHSPLESDGPTAIFSFFADKSGRGPEPYYVVVGRTEPNYYPANGLDPEEAFCLHLGTRFMLVLGVAQKEADPRDSYDPMADARDIVDRVAPDKPITSLVIAAQFAVEDQIHAVLRCEVSGEPVYIMARDAPTGFSRRIDLPPHVAYRLHLGHVLRNEPSPDEPGFAAHQG